MGIAREVKCGLERKKKKHREEDEKALQLLLSLVKTNWEALNDAKIWRPKVLTLGKPRKPKFHKNGGTCGHYTRGT